MRNISKNNLARLLLLISCGIILWCVIAFLVYQKNAWALILFLSIISLAWADYIYSSIIAREKELPKIEPNKMYTLIYFHKEESGYSAVLKYDKDGKTLIKFFDQVLFLSDPVDKDLGTIFISGSFEKEVRLHNKYH